jgi:hypothetical protein
VNIVNAANELNVKVVDVQRTILTLKSLGEVSVSWKVRNPSPPLTKLNLTPEP